MRVGMGYDVHKLVEGRDLILGGVKVPHSLGLLGLNAPINDLARGCNAAEVYSMAIITAALA